MVFATAADWLARQEAADPGEMLSDSDLNRFFSSLSQDHLKVIIKAVALQARHEVAADEAGAAEDDDVARFHAAPRVCAAAGAHAGIARDAGQSTERSNPSVKMPSPVYSR